MLLETGPAAVQVKLYQVPGRRYQVVDTTAELETGPAETTPVSWIFRARKVGFRSQVL